MKVLPEKDTKLINDALEKYDQSLVKSKDALFVRPNDVLYSYDFIMIDIYNQYKDILNKDMMTRIKNELIIAFSNGLLGFTLKEDRNRVLYFISDFNMEPVPIEHYNTIVYCKKANFLTADIWGWFMKNPNAYIYLAGTNISFYSKALGDVSKTENIFILCDDKFIPDQMILHLIMHDDILDKKCIPLDKLKDKFEEILKDNYHELTTTWITSHIYGGMDIVEKFLVGKIDDSILDRVLLNAYITTTNMYNLEEAQRNKDTPGFSCTIVKIFDVLNLGTFGNLSE